MARVHSGSVLSHVKKCTVSTLTTPPLSTYLSPLRHINMPRPLPTREVLSSLTQMFVVCLVCAGSDAGRGDPGDATGLHLTVSRSEQK